MTGLAPEQLARRRQFVCGSDAAKVMAGEWRALWLVKTGREPEEDLSGIFEVQLGIATESFNLDWLERTTGNKVVRRGEWAESPDYPFMACNLDGVTLTSKGQPAYVDAKHVGTLSEQTVLRYTPQGVHNATVLGLDWWMLSVIVGNKWPGPVEQPVDPFYQAELIAKEREFWGYVERDEEPCDPAVAVLPPKPMPKLRELVVPTAEDEVFEALCRQNNWLQEACGLIDDFAGTWAAATRHNITRDSLKKIVPEDVGLLRRGLFTLKRDRRGVTLNLAKAENDDA